MTCVQVKKQDLKEYASLSSSHGHAAGFVCDRCLQEIDQAAFDSNLSGMQQEIAALEAKLATAKRAEARAEVRSGYVVTSVLCLMGDEPSPGPGATSTYPDVCSMPEAGRSCARLHAVNFAVTASTSSMQRACLSALCLQSSRARLLT